MATTPRISSIYIDEDDEYFPDVELGMEEEEGPSHQRSPSRTPLDRTIDKIGMGTITQTLVLELIVH
jgi:hypothetical protein